MIYNIEKLKDSYYTSRIIVDKINCIFSETDTEDKWKYILLDNVENYKGDANLYYYEKNKKNEKRVEFKQRQNYHQIKNLYNKKTKWDTITIESDAVDFYKSDIYIQYDLTYEYLIIFYGKDIDTTKKEYRWTKTEKGWFLIGYYNVDMKKCEIIKI